MLELTRLCSYFKLYVVDAVSLPILLFDLGRAGPTDATLNALLPGHWHVSMYYKSSVP